MKTLLVLLLIVVTASAEKECEGPELAALEECSEERMSAQLAAFEFHMNNTEQNIQEMNTKCTAYTQCIKPVQSCTVFDYQKIYDTCNSLMYLGRFKQCFRRVVSGPSITRNSFAFRKCLDSELDGNVTPCERAKECTLDMIQANCDQSVVAMFMKKYGSLFYDVPACNKISKTPEFY